MGREKEQDKGNRRQEAGDRKETMKNANCRVENRKRE
jgi:hypothetical protein